MRAPSSQTLLETLQWLNEIGVVEPTCTTSQSQYTKLEPSPKMLQPATGSQKNKSLNEITTLDALRSYMQSYDQCALKNTATQLVFSDGISTSEIMVIGEAPGAEEDRLGKPFVGMSGQLLDKALASVGLSRQKNIYISNIIPWRPPGNRQPSTEEIAQCLPFIQKHIQLVSPKIILCAGSVAIKSLLNTNLGISRLRGIWHSYQIEAQKFLLLATYHPAFLLRSPSRKRDVWLDLLKLKEKARSIEISL
jgi:DNA polymerase